MSIYNQINFYGKNHEFVNRTDFFKKICKGKKVLHVGCADYPMTKERIRSGNLLHDQISKISNYCYGIDISDEGIAELNCFEFNNVAKIDAECMDNFYEKFEIVLAADVIEHMCSPFLFLKNVSKNITDDGVLVISVPNSFSIKILQYIINNEEPTHKDHCYYFSVKSLCELCARADYFPIDLAYTSQVKDMYDSNYFVAARDYFLKFFYKISPYIIIVFKKCNEKNEALRQVKFIYK